MLKVPFQLFNTTEALGLCSFISLWNGLSFASFSRIWVAQNFGAEAAQFKRKNLIQFWSIAEYFKFLYVRFFFIMITLMS